MTPTEKAKLEASSVLAWITLNNFVNEYGKPIEFTKHRFLIDYMADNHPLIVTKKAAQIGLTVAESLRNIHLAHFRHLNVIHTLQTSEVIQSFVSPKINPLIERNPTIKNLMKKVDSEGLKQFGDNFVFYRGANAESQAINITADVLCIDEYDRSNQRVVEIFQSRLDASDYKWKRYFSNPSAIGFGVDGLYNASDQRHWFVKCSHCSYESFIDFKKDETYDSHYVNIDNKTYACGKCGLELYDQDRIGGRWVVKYPSRSSDSHGYWFSQAMCPWISAKELIAKYNASSVDYFHNFVLGNAFTPTDLVVDRASIIRALAPGLIAKTQVAIGVDNGIIKHWVAATPEGIFDYGKTENWDDIERLKLMYNATMVIDANPYPNVPKQLVNKYPGQVFMNYYREDSKNLGIVRWGTKKDKGVVITDRTKIFDLVAQEINEAKLPYRMTSYQLEGYIQHWSFIYRTTEVDANGMEKGKWVVQENKPDHWAHAHIYMRIALSKVLGLGGGEMDFAEPLTKAKAKADYIDSSGGLAADFTASIEQAMDGTNKSTDWRYN